ncbi:hypothetical protein ACE6H2_023480 [Prunus campanulata]
MIYEPGWTGCICTGMARQYLQLMEFSWKSIPMLKLVELQPFLAMERLAGWAELPFYKLGLDRVWLD